MYVCNEYSTAYVEHHLKRVLQAARAAPEDHAARSGIDYYYYHYGYNIYIYI